jgi:hypothetical protein
VCARLNGQIVPSRLRRKLQDIVYMTLRSHGVVSGPLGAFVVRFARCSG